MSDDLAAFIRARLDEDEAAAKAALQYGQWSDKPWYSGEIHIARHAPGRVLREVEAKRKILGEHGPSRRDPGRCRVCTAIADTGATRFRAPCPTLRHLAAVYSDHLEFRPEWAE